MEEPLEVKTWRRCQPDWGVEHWSPYATPIMAARVARQEGIRHGYPTCCIDQFVADVLADKLPAMRRGTLPTENGGRYVPCYKCCEEIGRVTM